MYQITVIIPTLNRIKYLMETVENLKVSIDGFDQIEVIISDNNSNDGTSKWLEENIMGFKNWSVVYHKKLFPMYRHWNQIINIAKGEYILLLSDDDLVSKKMFEKCLKIINEEKKMSMIMFDHDLIDENGKILQHFNFGKSGRISKGTAFNYFKYGVSHRLCSIFFNKKLIEDCGGFDEKYNITAADSDLIQNCSLKGDVYFLSESDIKGYYRTWSGAATQQKLLSNEWHDEILRWCEKLKSYLSEYTEYDINNIIETIRFNNYMAAISENYFALPKNTVKEYMKTIPDFKHITSKKKILLFLARNRVLYYFYLKLKKLK